MNRFALRLAAGSLHSTLPRASATLAPAWRHLRQCGGVRTFHARLELPYNVENGMGEFLNPVGLKTVAIDFQQGLLERLNEEVQGTPLEHKNVVQTVIDAAQDPSLVLAFNYASEALNNSFFLQSLRPPKEGTTHNEADIDPYLMSRIRSQFASLEQLKSVFSSSVLGMFGTGWVWLVTDEGGQIAALPTFGTGTLLVRSQQSVAQGPSLIIGEEVHEPAPLSGLQPPPPTSPTSGLSRESTPFHPPTQTRSYSTAPDMTVASVHDNKMPSRVNPERVGEKLYPLACISVHEHAWVSAGYGVWGKEEYVKRFWSVIDWGKISRDFAQYAPSDHVRR